MHGGDCYRNEVNMDFSINVNPLGIPEEVTDAMQQALMQAMVYPGTASGDRQRLSKRSGMYCLWQWGIRFAACLCPGFYAKKGTPAGTGLFGLYLCLKKYWMSYCII